MALYLPLLITVLFFLVSFGLASLVPTAPGPGESFSAGTPCTIKWDVDITSSWTNVTIDLMSGSNSEMSLVVNVATALDGTDASLTPYLWTCPEVDPYSSIYFYQFTNDDDRANAQWTTRFTIAPPDGESTSPENTEQPNGDRVPWGTGALVSASGQSDNASNNKEASGVSADDEPDNSDKSKKDVKKTKSDKDSDDVDETSATEQATSTRMVKRPKPTHSSTRTEPVEDVSPTPGLPPPCPSTGSSSSSASCLDSKVVSKGFRSLLMIPMKVHVLIIVFCILRVK